MGTLVLVLSSGKQALDAVRLERGRMVAERVMLIEREEVAGRDDYPTDSALQKWAHDAGSLLIGDQKDRVTRPRLRPVVHEAVPVQSYSRLHSLGQCSEELLEKILRGVSAQQYTETLLNAAGAFGVSPSSVPRKRVALTAKKREEFQERSLANCCSDVMKPIAASSYCTPQESAAHAAQAMRDSGCGWATCG